MGKNRGAMDMHTDTDSLVRPTAILYQNVVKCKDLDRQEIV